MRFGPHVVAIEDAEMLAQRKPVSVVRFIAGRAVSRLEADEHNRRLLHEEAIFMLWDGRCLPDDVKLPQYLLEERMG